MALKFILAAVAAAAVGVGLVLPGPHPEGRLGQDEPRSQISQLELHR